MARQESPIPRFPPGVLKAVFFLKKASHVWEDPEDFWIWSKQCFRKNVPSVS